jgi:D-3-phosphoglycerate dehydrogenase
MKILVNDGLSAEGVAAMRSAGLTVDDIKIPQEELPAKIAPYDAVVVRSASKIRKDVIDAGTNLKAIVRGGVGVDNIDVTYAEAKGIKVMNTPAASSASVAELALAHIFAMARFIPDANITMREGLWEKKKYAKGIEVGGKTLGILGIGRIGRELAKRGLALGMKVIAFDPYVKSIDLPVDLLTKDEVLTRADFLSLHMPKDPAGYVLSTAELAKMKPGAFVINCARGGVVDEKALLAALNEGKLGGAGIDVFEAEPTANLDLVKHPKVSVTPHIGANTEEAQDRVGAEVARLLIDFFK